MSRDIATQPVPEGEGPRLVVTANTDHIVQLSRNAAFRHAYDRAWAITADGWPVVAYARAYNGYTQGRVTGADLFPLIIAQLSPGRSRIFCIASSTRTARKLVEHLERDGLPRAMVEVEVPPFGFENDRAYSLALAKRITQYGTTHLFLGVGAPKSEIWVDVHREFLGDLYACCFGASLNFYAGTRRRAPWVAQAIGLEWAWRLCSEPKRLAVRYMRGSIIYLSLILRDLARNGIRRVPPSAARDKIGS